MRSPWATSVVSDVFIFIRLTGYNRGLDEYWVTPLFYFRIYFGHSSAVWHMGCWPFEIDMPLGWLWRWLLVFASSQSSMVAGAAGTNAENRRPHAQVSEDPRIVAMFNTPIAFYGRVVDEAGQAIFSARVTFSVIDKFWQERGTRFEALSDEKGLFSLTNVRGAAVSVAVVKDNYHTLPRPKSFPFYGPLRGKSDPEPPTPSDPAVFVLRRKLEAEPMIRRGYRYISVPGDGTPAVASFHPRARSGGVEVPDFHVQLWKASSTNAQRQYNWRYKFSIPGGGLVDRKDTFNFQAPSEGYQEVIEGAMEAGTENWHTSVQRDFFGKLPNGCYVRFRVSLSTRSKSSFGIESFMNPASGSTHLEFDPKMVLFPE